MKRRPVICPFCGEGELVFAASGATVTYPVYVENGKPFVDWSDPYVDDSGCTEAYICEHCGEQVALHIEELEAMLNVQSPG